MNVCNLLLGMKSWVGSATDMA